MAIVQRTLQVPAKPKARPTPTFNPGDVVRLNSGGPNMLVMGVIEGFATCVWIGDPHEHRNSLEFSKFNVHTVRIVAKNT